LSDWLPFNTFIINPYQHSAYEHFKDWFFTPISTNVSQHLAMWLIEKNGYYLSCAVVNKELEMVPSPSMGLPESFFSLMASLLG